MMEFKTIGDSLTDEEFNAFVSLVRANNQVNHYFNISENKINDDLYTLQFDFTDSTILDNGLFITDKTKENPPKCMLKDVLFKHSTHSIDFKVLDPENYRLYEEDNRIIEYDTLTMELEENSEISFPISMLDNGSVVLFDNVKLIILHDKPTIKVIDDE